MTVQKGTPYLYKKNRISIILTITLLCLPCAAQTTKKKKNLMPNNTIKGSLSEIVDKMNKKYDGLIGEGFNLGLDRRVVPVMIDGVVSGWKMQRCENCKWVDMDETPFESMQALIEHYKCEK